LVGDEAEKGRLLQLHGHTLAQGSVEDGVVGGICESGKHNRVFLTKNRLAGVQKKRRVKAETASRRITATEIHPQGFVSLTCTCTFEWFAATILSSRSRYKVHSLGKTIPSAGHRNDVLAILRALA
jgi:hypothetical protein